MFLQVYDLDPAQRPDRDSIAKEIDKLDNGRTVTQYDVLAWMQTKKRMLKKKEERQAMLKEQMRPQTMSHGAMQPWQMQHPQQQQPFLVHGGMPAQPGPDGQPAPPPDDSVGPPLTPGAQGQPMLAGVQSVQIVGVGPPPGGGVHPNAAMVAKQTKLDKMKRPRMDYNDAQARVFTPAPCTKGVLSWRRMLGRRVAWKGGWDEKADLTTPHSTGYCTGAGVRGTTSR